MTQPMLEDTREVVEGSEEEWKLFFPILYAIRQHLSGPMKRYVPKRDQDEVVQEVALAAIINWRVDREFLERVGVNCWSVGAVKRAAGNIAKKRRRDDLRSTDYEYHHRGVRPEGLHPERDLEIRERQAAIERAFGGLAGRLREVAKLRFIQGMSYDEIRDTLNLSPATVKAYVHDARVHLEKALAAWDDRQARARGPIARAFSRHVWTFGIGGDARLRRRLRLGLAEGAGAGSGSGALADTPEARQELARTQARFREKLRVVRGPGGDGGKPYDFDSFEALSADWERFLRARGFDVVPEALQASVLVRACAHRAPPGASRPRWRRAIDAVAVQGTMCLWWWQNALLGPLDPEE